KPPASGVAVYLTVSNVSPQIGDRVVVTARAVRGPDAAGIGSFLLTATYDSTRLHVVDAQGPTDALVVVNPINGAIAAAGVSATGFASGELFHFTLDVKEPIALRTLAADVKELVSIKFADSRPSMSLER